MIRNLFTLICSAAFLQSCIISKQSNIGFVKKRHIDKEAEVMSIGASTFFAKPFLKSALEGEDTEALQFVKSIRGIRLTSIENQEDFSIINERMTSYLNRKNYEEWLTIQTENEHISINAKQNKAKIKRILIGINSDDGDGVFIRIKGKIDLNAMNHTVQNMTDTNFKLKTKKGTEVALN